MFEGCIRFGTSLLIAMTLVVCSSTNTLALSFPEKMRVKLARLVVQEARLFIKLMAKKEKITVKYGAAFLSADFNGDGVVTTSDISFIISCVLSDGSIEKAGMCTIADLNKDSWVDTRDWSLAQMQMTLVGANIDAPDINLKLRNGLLRILKQEVKTVAKLRRRKEALFMKYALQFWSGDFNWNGLIDNWDFVFVRYCMPVPEGVDRLGKCVGADLNADLRVDQLDLDMLTQQWQAQQALLFPTPTPTPAA